MPSDALSLHVNVSVEVHGTTHRTYGTTRSVNKSTASERRTRLAHLRHVATLVQDQNPFCAKQDKPLPPALITMYTPPFAHARPRSSRLGSKQRPRAPRGHTYMQRGEPNTTSPSLVKARPICGSAELCKTSMCPSRERGVRVCVLLLHPRTRLGGAPPLTVTRSRSCVPSYSSTSRAVRDHARMCLSSCSP